MKIGKFNLPYKIKRSDRKSVGFAIGPNMQLIVKAPQEVSVGKIEKLIEKKKPWIFKKIKDIKKQKPAPLDKEFLSGEKLLYKGRRYKLKVNKVKNDERLSFDKGIFNLYLEKYNKEKERRSRAKNIIKDWYKNRAKKELKKKANYYASSTGLSPKGIKIKSLNKKWGEHKKGTIELNWRLIMTPTKVQDYIIVHELTHLEYSNHSAKFWSLVGAVIPDYKERREWLKINGKLFNI